MLAILLPLAHIAMRDVFLYEPYPTLLMPAGAGLFDADEAAVFTREVYATVGTERRRLVYSALLPQMPDGMRYRVVNRGFGLQASGVRGWMLGGEALARLLPRGEVTGAEVVAARRWLHAQASRAAGESVDSLVVLSGRRIVSSGTIGSWRSAPREVAIDLTGR